MNSQHRTIRALINSMGTERATDFIKAFNLPEKEQICLIEKDVNDLSYTQICNKYGFSPEVVKKSRRRAYHKISDDLAYREEKGREN